MATQEGNGVPWWGRDIQRRLDNIENRISTLQPIVDNNTSRSVDLQRRVDNIEHLKPEVMSDRITTALEEIRSLRRSFYTFAFSVVLAAVVFAFSVFSLLGNHP